MERGTQMLGFDQYTKDILENQIIVLALLTNEGREYMPVYNGPVTHDPNSALSPMAQFLHFLGGALAEGNQEGICRGSVSNLLFVGRNRPDSALKGLIINANLFYYSVKEACLFFPKSRELEKKSLLDYDNANRSVNILHYFRKHRWFFDEKNPVTGEALFYKKITIPHQKLPQIPISEPLIKATEFPQNPIILDEEGFGTVPPKMIGSPLDPKEAKNFGFGKGNSPSGIFALYARSIAVALNGALTGLHHLKTNGNNIGGLWIDKFGRIAFHGGNSKQRYQSTLTDFLHHAEMGTVANKPSHVSDLRDGIFVTSMKPCHMCGGQLCECDVKEVIYSLNDPSITGDALSHMMKLDPYKRNGRAISFVSTPVFGDEKSVLLSQYSESLRKEIDRLFIGIGVTDDHSLSPQDLYRQLSARTPVVEAFRQRIVKYVVDNIPEFFQENPDFSRIPRKILFSVLDKFLASKKGVSRFVNLLSSEYVGQLSILQKIYGLLMEWCFESDDKRRIVEGQLRKILSSGYRNTDATPFPEEDIEALLKMTLNALMYFKYVYELTKFPQKYDDLRARSALVDELNAEIALILDFAKSVIKKDIPRGMLKKSEPNRFHSLSDEVPDSPVEQVRRSDSSDAFLQMYEAEESLFGDFERDVFNWVPSAYEGAQAMAGASALEMMMPLENQKNVLAEEPRKKPLIVPKEGKTRIFSHGLVEDVKRVALGVRA